MDKQEVLRLISQLSSENLVTRDEILRAFENRIQTNPVILKRTANISDVLYFIGGLIVFSGISVLISQNWSSLNFYSKLLCTLGIGIVTYILGILLNKEEKYGALGYAFHLIAALVIPLGLSILLEKLGYNTASHPSVLSFLSAFLSVFYAVSYFIFRKTIFTFFTIIYSTWFFFSYTFLILEPIHFISQQNFSAYQVLVVGISYLFLGHYFINTDKRDLTGVLYGFGNFFFLGAALFLGGWSPTQNIFWELLFPILIGCILFLSIRLKSKAFLTFGTVYLMLYIMKITGEYFKETLGWPFSLILCGFALIGIGYYAFSLNKKYFNEITNS